MRIVAVIPVKEKSDRVPSKNFREFYDGQSLLDILLDKLLSSQIVDKVYISSNATNIRSNVEKLGCIYLPRNNKYCSNEISWSDVIYNVVKSIPENDNVSIAWCHTTSPLFDDYDSALQRYLDVVQEGSFDGLVTVSELSEFLVSENGRPINYSWGPWHKYSQHLEKIYSITGALFISKKYDMLLNRYVISKNPSYYTVSELASLDIDTEYDFELAKILMKQKSKLLNHDSK
jgi:N-acylneuraminate cytidylyltransferase